MIRTAELAGIVTKKPTKKRIASFQARCHEYGLRVTPQRVAIYEELSRARNHPTAEQVHLKVRRRFPTISLNTVNETLLTFSRIGLVQIVEGFGGSRRYDPNMMAHHHVHCIQCGRIIDFNSDEFDRLEVPRDIRRRYAITSLRVVVTGICPRCRRNRT